MVRMYPSKAVQLLLADSLSAVVGRGIIDVMGNRAGHFLRTRLTSQAIVGCKHDEGGMVLHWRNRAMVRQGTSTFEDVDFWSLALLGPNILFAGLP
jgi:hypothetical protein